MGKVILGLTMSLDGFIQDKDGSVSRLYPDMEAMHEAATLQEAIQNTGAVVLGWRAFAMGEPDDYADHYEFQVPIFVLTHAIPATLPKQNDRLTFTFVTDGIASAIQKAQAAAGAKDVTVIGGAQTAQQCLRAGLVDELQIDIAPVLLGEGLRLFEHLTTAPVELERTRVVEEAGVTHLRFRIVKGEGDKKTRRSFEC